MHKEPRTAQVIVMSTLNIWSHCSNLWHWGIHTCLMSYSWNALRRKEVLTHWSPVPSSGALWEGGRISVQYLQWPFPLTGQGPMGKNWRRQTMNNGVQGWAMVPGQHVPLRDVDYRGLGGHGKDQGTSGVPQEHTWDTCSETLCYLKHNLSPLFFLKWKHFFQWVVWRKCLTGLLNLIVYSLAKRCLKVWYHSHICHLDMMHQPVSLA